MLQTNDDKCQNVFKNWNAEKNKYSKAGTACTNVAAGSLAAGYSFIVLTALTGKPTEHNMLPAWNPRDKKFPNPKDIRTDRNHKYSTVRRKYSIPDIRFKWRKR